MPDNIHLDSQFLLDKNAQFNLKLDTYNRLNEVMNRKDNPMFTGSGSESPFFQNQTSSAPPPKLIPIDEAILSPDQNIRDLANQTVNTPTLAQKLGVGTVVSTPYEETKKYVGKEFGYDVARPNQEDFYYKNVYEKENPFMRILAYNPSRFVSRVAWGAGTKFLEGAGYLGSMLTSAFQDGGYWANVADNGFSKFFAEADQSFRDYVTPVYKQAGFDEKGFFSKLTDWTYWNDSLADGAAFLASAFIPVGIASKTGLLAKGAGLFGEATSLARGASATAKFLTGAETWGEAGLWAFNTANESAFEAAGTFKEAKQNLIDQRAKGLNTLSDEQIDQEAGKKAATTFTWNLAALSASNAWENKAIFKPLFGSSPKAPGLGNMSFANLQAYGKDAGRIMKDLSFYGKKAFTASSVEGFWEENIQTAISRVAEGEYTRRGKGLPKEGITEKTGAGLLGIIKQYGKQTAEAFQGKDIEAAEAIETGSLIGILGSTLTSKIAPQINPATGKPQWFVGERKTQERETNSRIAAINNAANNIFSFQDVYKEDGSIDHEKLGEKLKSLDEFTSRQGLLNALQDTKQITKEEVQVLQNSLLNTYVMNVAKAGKLQEAITSLTDKSAKSAEQLVAMGLSATEIRNNPAEVASYMQTVGKMYNDIQSQDIQSSPPKGYTPDQIDSINQSRRDVSFKLLAERQSLQPIFTSQQNQINRAFSTVARNVETNIKSTTIENNLTNNRATDYVQHLSQRKYYEDILKDDKNAPQFVKDFYQSKIDEATSSMAELDELLGDDKPTIKNGRPHTRSKNVNAALEAYQDLYTKQAELEHAQAKSDALAESILDPVNGFDNFNDYMNYIKATEEEVPTAEIIESTTPPVEQPPITTTPPPAPPVVTPPPGAPQPPAAPPPPPPPAAPVGQPPTPPDTTPPPAGQPQEEAPATDQQKETTETTLTVDVDEQANVEDDPTPKTGDVSFVNPENPTSWFSPLKTTNKQTISNFDNPTIAKDVEQLTTDEYTNAISDFIQTYQRDAELQAVITGDRAEWVDRFPKEQREEALSNLGQVMMFKKNDIPLTIGTVFGNKYPNLSHLPILQSFNKGSFNNQRSLRAGIKAKKEETTIAEAEASYQFDESTSDNVRKFLRENPTSEVEVTLYPSLSSEGVIPTTSSATVNSRFGEEFTLGIAHALTNPSLLSHGYSQGTVVATFSGGKSIPVFTKRINEIADLDGDITALLNHKYESLDEARRVVAALKDLIYVTPTRGFVAETTPSGVRIKFINNQNSSPVNVQRINVNHKIFTNQKQLIRYSVKNGKLVQTSINNTDYKAFIKENVITTRKKVTTSNGELHTDAVNPYFSFSIPDTKFHPKKDSKQYDTFKAKLDKQKTLTPEQKEGSTQAIQNNYNKNIFNKHQRDTLLTQLETIPLIEPEVYVPPTSEALTDEEVRSLFGTEYSDVPTEGEEDVDMSTIFGNFGEPEIIPAASLSIPQSIIETEEQKLRRSWQEELQNAEKNWRTNVNESGIPKESLQPIVEEINNRYRVQLDAFHQISTREAEEQKKEDEIIPATKTGLAALLDDTSDDISLKPADQSSYEIKPSSQFITSVGTVDFESGQILSQEELTPTTIEDALSEVPDAQFRKYTGTDEQTYFALGKQGENNIITLNSEGLPISNIKELLSPTDLKDFEELEKINC